MYYYYPQLQIRKSRHIRDEVPYLKLPNLRAVVFFNDSDDEGWCLNIAGVIC